MIPYDKFLITAAKSLEKSIEKSLISKPHVLHGEREAVSLATINIRKKHGIKTVVDIHNIWSEEFVATWFPVVRQNVPRHYILTKHSPYHTKYGLCLASYHGMIPPVMFKKCMR